MVFKPIGFSAGRLRSAQESSRGAGQYFTPRPVIQAMCEVTQPTPQDSICDPAAGTGGFLCNAYQYVLDRFEKDLDRDEKRALQEELVEGMELSPKVGRMCAMNLYLHGIGGEKVAIHTGHDSLAAPWSHEYSLILANPPFGKKQSLLFVNEEGDTEKEDQVIVREDFWTSTSNKQLNFVQHIYTLLKIDGRAAVVVPDNVLFEGGAGEKVRRNLLQKCRVHTLLRLPTGIWYSPGVKANVIFFEKKEGRAEAWTDRLWVYDLRTNLHFTLKQSPIQRKDFDEFVACYKPGRLHERKRDVERREPRRPLALLRLRGPAQARQAEPRSLLDQGQEPDGHRFASAAGCHRHRDRRRSGSGAGAVHEDRRSARWRGQVMMVLIRWGRRGLARRRTSRPSSAPGQGATNGRRRPLNGCRRHSNCRRGRREWIGASDDE